MISTRFIVFSVLLVQAFSSQAQQWDSYQTKAVSVVVKLPLVWTTDNKGLVEWNTVTHSRKYVINQESPNSYFIPLASQGDKLWILDNDNYSIGWIENGAWTVFPKSVYTPNAGDGFSGIAFDGNTVWVAGHHSIAHYDGQWKISGKDDGLPYNDQFGELFHVLEREDR